MQTNQPDRLLRIEEIITGKSRLIPLSRTAFYAAINRGELPKPKKIGRTSVWPESELRAAIAALPGGGSAEVSVS